MEAVWNATEDGARTPRPAVLPLRPAERVGVRSPPCHTNRGTLPSRARSFASLEDDNFRPSCAGFPRFVMQSKAKHLARFEPSVPSATPEDGVRPPRQSSSLSARRRGSE